MTSEALIRAKFDALKGSMDERMTRLWAGAEAEAVGRGGLAMVSRATGLALNTVARGRNELRSGAKVDDLVNVRRRGAGNRNHVDVQPELLPALKRLVDPATRGDPESGLRWSAERRRVVARAVRRARHPGERQDRRQTAP